MASPYPQAQSQDVAAPVQASEKDTPLKAEPPPLLAKLSYAAHIYSLQSFISPYLWVRDWKEYFYPPEGGPNIIKRYEVRPYLPVRIFFPKSYDQTSPAVLPTLFTIHGGGFCIGHSRDDDEWNRRFANRHRTLVVALNYSKSPQYPFPTALHDVEALLLACLADESLPIDRSSRRRGSTELSRTAILGFSAGGNLALAASQLPRVRGATPPLAAAVSVYGCLDLSVPAAEKLANRPVKPELPPPRGGKDAGSDPLAGLAPTFDWSYIPYGHDLRDPLLSPAFAEGGSLPPFVGVVAAELDMLAHESWRLACRLSREHGGRRRVPDRRSGDERERVCGRREVGRRRGALEDINDQRFGWEESWDGRARGVKWLLVPDVLHGFDNPHIRGLMGGDKMIKDAEMKTRAYVEEVGNWLRERVWGL